MSAGRWEGAHVPVYGGAIPTPPEWTARAACAGHAPLHDPRMAREAEEAFQARSADARAVCGRCPVMADCREWVEASPRAKVAGTLAGHTFALVHPKMPSRSARRTTFSAASAVA
ncbi:WhiB family transcriptional regulator [Dietzia sp. ANT_WB102]|uniref:WhiB family transcriptional regulator n=1 Tax=Dietzia sp. ANT_WB102 TaxID=2597345 RepID=UPI00165DBC84|nr:WhiB family transcriptional regulator [Dietzia sp. ANT_WB102]